MTPDPTTIDLGELLLERTFVERLARGLLFDDHAVDDVVQQTWLDAARRPPRTTDRRSTRAWLAQVLRHNAHDRLRQDRRRKSREHRTTLELDAASPGAEDSTTAALAREEMRQVVVECLRQLEEPYRSVVAARYLEERSAAEIARSRGVPQATIRSQLRRGLQRMRTQLDERAGGRRDWCLALVPIAAREKGGGSGVMASALKQKLTMKNVLILSASSALVSVAYVQASSPTDDQIRPPAVLESGVLESSDTPTDDLGLASLPLRRPAGAIPASPFERGIDEGPRTFEEVWDDIMTTFGPFMDSDPRLLLRELGPDRIRELQQRQVELVAEAVTIDGAGPLALRIARDLPEKGSRPEMAQREVAKSIVALRLRYASAHPSLRVQRRPAVLALLDALDGSDADARLAGACFNIAEFRLGRDEQPLRLDGDLMKPSRTQWLDLQLRTAFELALQLKLVDPEQEFDSEAPPTFLSLEDTDRIDRLLSAALREEEAGAAGGARRPWRHPAPWIEEQLRALWRQGLRADEAEIRETTRAKLIGWWAGGDERRKRLAIVCLLETEEHRSTVLRQLREDGSADERRRVAALLGETLPFDQAIAVLIELRRGESIEHASHSAEFGTYRALAERFPNEIVAHFESCADDPELALHRLALMYTIHELNDEEAKRLCLSILSREPIASLRIGALFRIANLAEETELFELWDRELETRIPAADRDGFLRLTSALLSVLGTSLDREFDPKQVAARARRIQDLDRRGDYEQNRIETILRRTEGL